MQEEIETFSTNIRKPILLHRHRKTADFNKLGIKEHNSMLFQDTLGTDDISQPLMVKGNSKRLTRTSLIEPALSEDGSSDRSESQKTQKSVPYYDHLKLTEENEIVIIL